MWRNIKYVLFFFLYIVCEDNNILCAQNANTVSVTTPKKKSDALEPLNRFFLNFNTMIGYAFLDPITYGYEKVVPKSIQARVTDFLRNLMTPFYCLCSLLAGEGKETVKGLGSFILNTLCGGGFFNVANYTPKYKSLDNTFAKYGMKQGEYVVLPFLGPSSVRDVLAKAIGCFVNPFYIFTKNIDHRDHVWIGHAIVTYIDINKGIYKNMNALRKSSGNDYYSMVKSVYLQTADPVKNEYNAKEDEYADDF